MSATALQLVERPDDDMIVEAPMVPPHAEDDRLTAAVNENTIAIRYAGCLTPDE